MFGRLADFQETDVSGGARALQVTFDQDRLDQQASMFTQGELSDDPRGFASKLCLPDGTKRTVFKGFEEVYIPPPQLPPKAEYTRRTQSVTFNLVQV